MRAILTAINQGLAFVGILLKASCATFMLWITSALGVISSVGRALRLHRRCQEFESLITHH